MFDELKLKSEKLNAIFKITVYVPDDYDKTDNDFNALYILSNNNPFLNKDYKLEELLTKKNIIGIAIYPNIDIQKNKLLYNSFDDKYGFNELYEKFITDDIRNLICQKYRIKRDMLSNFVLGFNDTALLAYSLAYHHSSSFSKVLAYDLHVEGFKKLFITDLISSFDPNINFVYSMKDEQTKNEIANTLKIFGAPNFGYVDNLDEILQNI